SCRLPEENVELVERAGPALAMLVAARRIGKRAVDQGQFGLVADGTQLDPHGRFMAARRGVIAIGVMRPGADQPHRLLDLEILARRGKDATSFLPPLDAPGPARPDIDHTFVDGDTRRAHPLSELRLLRPRCEHAL